MEKKQKIAFKVLLIHVWKRRQNDAALTLRGQIMLIPSFMFSFLDCTGLALHNSQFKITPSYTWLIQFTLCLNHKKHKRHTQQQGRHPVLNEVLLWSLELNILITLVFWNQVWGARRSSDSLSITWPQVTKVLYWTWSESSTWLYKHTSKLFNE